ncbi:hypothetical protein SAMN05446935_3081 [Burkholderia sp. YR290]|nr:hypothetical protein SAMN05446935_3081 [Burkholderia sp. YR290]
MAGIVTIHHARTAAERATSLASSHRRIVAKKGLEPDGARCARFARIPCKPAGDLLKYRYLSRRSLLPLRRSAEELSFAFSELLAQPLSRPEAAARFETLWNEVNNAAQSCDDSDAAFTYIALLHSMDQRWRFLRSMN